MTIEEYIKNVIKEKKALIEKRTVIRAAKQLEKEFPKIMENAMNQFYLAYNPKEYIRTYDLYRGVVNGIKSKINENTLSISVTSDNVHDRYGWSGKSFYSGENIFMDAFEHGIHGKPQYCISTPPWMYFEEDVVNRYEELVYKIYPEVLAECL